MRGFVLSIRANGGDMTFLKFYKGFTLAEMLIVFLIICILSFIGIPIYTKTMQRSFAADAVAVLEEISAKQEVYYTEHGVYAADFDALHPPIKGLSGSGGITLGQFQYYMDGSCAVAKKAEYKIFKNYKTQECMCFGSSCDILKGILEQGSGGCDTSLGG